MGVQKQESGRIRAYTLRQKKKQEEDEAAEAERKAEAERQRREAAQKIIDDRRRRRAFNLVRLTPQNYGLSNNTMGFNGSTCASRISQCEGLWNNLSSSDPLKEEKRWAVAIFMYTNKGAGKNHQFYTQVNNSLRAGTSTYSVYVKLLTEALHYIIEKQNIQVPNTLYRGICLQNLFALQYENQNFSNFKASKQFSSFTTTRRMADKFAAGGFNHEQNGNNVSTVLQLTRANSAKIAYIGDKYGLSSETEWLAPPGTSYNVGNYSKVTNTFSREQGFQVNLTPVNQRRRLALKTATFKGEECSS